MRMRKGIASNLRIYKYSRGKIGRGNIGIIESQARVNMFMKATQFIAE